MGQEHLGGCRHDGHTFLPDVWDYLLAKYAIRSVVDVGCGYGYAAKYFLDQGLDVIGVEGYRLAIEQNRCPKRYLIEHDYTQGPLTIRPVDLAWAGEFVEHVEARFRDHFLTTFACARYVCLTHAVPGQGGYHHVNEQPTAYWVRELARYGFRHNEAETAFLRLGGERTPWGRRTLTFFERAGRGGRERGRRWQLRRPGVPSLSS